VRTWQIVFAKYLASVVFYCILWVPSLANFAIFQTMTNGAAEIPQGALYGTYILLFAMGLFNLSLGCLASALTANQIVAAVVSFTASLMHFLVGAFILYFQRSGQKAFVDFVYYIASVQHIETFTNGLLDTRPLVYYASMSALFLVITHQVLEFRRWRV
jgi:ABC-2 type transport system permease protein